MATSTHTGVATTPIATLTEAEFGADVHGVLQRVANGDNISIDIGKGPLIRLRPIERPLPEDAISTDDAARRAAAIEKLRELRKGNSLAGLKLRDLIHEGHKY